MIAARFDEHGVYDDRQELPASGPAESTARVDTHDFGRVYPRYAVDTEPR